MRRIAATCVLVALVVAGCSQLPGAGPSAAGIVGGGDEPAGLAYTVVDVNEPVLDLLAGRFKSSLAGTFGPNGARIAETIGIGDEVDVTIWEAANGGLFSSSAGQLVGGGSKSTQIPTQPVGSTGTISIPYAGSVQAAGRTPIEVKTSIEAALAGKAIEPQALVTVRRAASNRVTVMGDAARGGVVPLTVRGLRLLDAVAASGGVAAPVEEVTVELVRGGTTARVPLTRIISEPNENVYLRPDDVVALLQQPQLFTAFGATGANTQVKFPVTGITLDEAIARVGGLQDFRADPAGVFVFRYEQPAIARQLSPDAAQQGLQGGIPVVYRLDLKDPSGLFRAQRFEVADGDLVYVANANLNELQKFIALIGTINQPFLLAQRFESRL